VKGIKRVITKLLEEFVFFKHFIYPNFRRLKSGKIIFKSKPRIEQLTICSGKGIVFIGEKCAFGYKLGGFNRGGSVEIQARDLHSKILIEDNVLTNNNVFICAANLVRIGNNTLIGQNVVIMDHEAHGVAPDKRRMVGEIGEVYIENNVWIGNNVTILKNSKIGDNSIIAAGSVVNGTFPANVIIGGVPAKIIRKL
jgi:acetyltransferase-like isoleucine patch superfamily enzyme